MRVWAFGLVVGLAGLLGVDAVASLSKAPATVTCASIIFPSGSFTWRPERVVLGVAAVPPAYIPQTTESGIDAWPFWSKSGLVVRANSPPLHISVPERWRSRAAITWGNTRIADALRVARCPRTGALGDWNPYAGGFYLRSRAACVPLVFRVGKRSATVRFGVGKRCR